jgi:cytochrome P450
MTPAELRRLPWVPAFARPLERNMLDVDEPDHRRLRNLVQKAFTPRRVEALAGRVQGLADGFLDAARPRGRMDLVGDYALPLPLSVICELLGIPGGDRPRFRRWARRILRRQTTLNTLLAAPAVWSMLRYLRALFRERSARPADDLVTALVQAREGDDSLSEDELLAMVFILLIAGHETTVNLIASGTLALLENPAQLELLRREPARAATAVEELLRYTSPVETATERYAREDITVAGVKIPRGEMVLAALASANRDAAHFERPDALDISRAPNRHLAFGHGIHFCLGAPLARLEGQIALLTLLRRMPALRLAVPKEKLRWRPLLALRGLEALPVAF